MFKDALSLINRGREGKSITIPFPFERLSEHVGLSPRMYYLIGGESGSGKSSFAHQVFALHPYEWLLDNPDSDINLKAFLWVMERPKEYVIAKWICQRIWKKYGILIDVRDVLSQRTDRTLDDDVYQRVLETEEYFEGLSKCIKIFNVRSTPTEIFVLLRKWARKNGTEYDQKGKVIDNRRAKFEKPTVWSYEPDDPNLLTVAMVDHLGLASMENGNNRKSNIDALSSYFQTLRDMYGFTLVGVQQFNRNIRDTTRRVKLVLQPEPSDLEHSSDPFHDADVTIGLMNPYKYNLNEYLKYKINLMVAPSGHNRFRTSILMKNTYGIDDIHAGHHFVGENGYFGELPPPHKLSAQDYFRLSRLPSSTIYREGQIEGQADLGLDDLNFD